MCPKHRNGLQKQNYRLNNKIEDGIQHKKFKIKKKQAMYKLSQDQEEYDKMLTSYVQKDFVPDKHFFQRKELVYYVMLIFLVQLIQ